MFPVYKTLHSKTQDNLGVSYKYHWNTKYPLKYKW